MTKPIVNPPIKFSQKHGIDIDNKTWQQVKAQATNNALFIAIRQNKTAQSAIKDIATNIQLTLNAGDLDRAKIVEFSTGLINNGLSSDETCELLESLIVLAKHNNYNLFETKTNWFGDVNKTSHMEKFLDTDLEEIARASIEKKVIDQSIIDQANKALIQSSVAESCKILLNSDNSSASAEITKRNRLDAANYHSKSAESYFNTADKSKKAHPALADGLTKLANQELVACSEMLPKKLELVSPNTTTYTETTTHAESPKAINHNQNNPNTLEITAFDQILDKNVINPDQSAEIQEILKYIKNVFPKNKDKITPEAFYTTMINIGKILINKHMPINQASMEIRYNLFETLHSLNQCKPDSSIPLSYDNDDNEILLFINNILSSLDQVLLHDVDLDKLTFRYQHIMASDNQKLLIKNYREKHCKAYIKNFTDKVLPDIKIPPMSPQEQHLIYKMINRALLKKHDTQKDFQEDFAAQFKHQIYNLYRPSENPETAIPTLSDPKWITPNEENTLKALHYGLFTWRSQFCNTGYKVNVNENKIEFNMVHPLIIFMVYIYTTQAQAEKLGVPGAKEFVDNHNKINFEIILEDYNKYHADKINIDIILLKIFIEAKASLLIADRDENGECRNRLI